MAQLQDAARTDATRTDATTWILIPGRPPRALDEPAGTALAGPGAMPAGRLRARRAAAAIA